MTARLRAMKRLFCDIETSPNVVLAFSAGYNLTINHDSIVHERKVICIGWKWEGERTCHVDTWSAKQDDRELVRGFMRTLTEADEVVAHYGSHFDIPWLRTRCIIHHLDPIPLVKIVDTKQLASRFFLFNSNKLDYISQVLGHGAKLKTDFSLWKRILMQNDRKALAYMAKYCGIDVRRLESVYKDLSRYVRPASHAGVLDGKDKWTCSHCGSNHVHTAKTTITAMGTKQYRMKCNKCGSFHTISAKAHDDYLAAKAKQ